MKTLFIIDANSLIHRAYHALPAFTSPSSRPVGAIYGISSILLKILKERKPDYIAAAFDRPEPTFRHGEYKEYKGTRAKADDELVAQLIEARRTFEVFGVKTFEAPGFEADDIIMTLARRFSDEGLRIVMFSGDLDLIQGVAGDRIILETPKKGISDSVQYDDKAVKERFGINPTQMSDYKGLVGDNSDNIPGVPGIGPKTAAELINKYGSLEAMYDEIDTLGMSNLKLMAKLKEGKEGALMSKHLAILRIDVPVDVSLEDLKSKGLNQEAAKKYFSDLGFESLVGRIS